MRVRFLKDDILRKGDFLIGFSSSVQSESKKIQIIEKFKAMGFESENEDVVISNRENISFGDLKYDVVIAILDDAYLEKSDMQDFYEYKRKSEDGLLSLFCFYLGSDNHNDAIWNHPSVKNLSTTIDEFEITNIGGQIIELIKAKNYYKSRYYHKIVNLIKDEENNKTGVLNLGNSELDFIPSEVFKMSHLETLIFGDNTSCKVQNGLTIFLQTELDFSNRNFISIIPDEISLMVNLKNFSIGGDYDDKYPIKRLGGLKNHPSIEVLDLSFCSFESMEEFQNLPNLVHLDLSRNRIEKLNEIYFNLPKLKFLDLSENFIREIAIEDRFKLLLEQLDYINLKKNPINYDWINPAVLETSGDDVEDLLYLITAHLNKELRKVDSLPQKVILLGNSEVGKTSLAKILIKDKKQFPDAGSTDGLKIRVWKMSKKKKEKTAFVYDFGGQDFYHSVYNMFFTLDTIYIVVWDDKDLENKEFKSAKSNDTFIIYNPNYWMGNIKYYIDRAPSSLSQKHIEVISLHNNFREQDYYQHLNADLRGLNHHFTLSLNPDKIMSESSKLKIELLAQTIYDQSEMFDSKFSLTEDDIKIVDKILIEFEKNEYKKYLINQFYSEFGEPSFKGFLKVMHQKGLIFYLDNHADLNNYLWINPSTISSRIYDIFDKSTLLNIGEISLKDFDDHISNDYEFKKLLIHQEIIFIDDSRDESLVVLPQYLPLTPYDDFLFGLASEGMETIFAIRFKDYMPHGLMARLMCRLGKNPGKKYLYRYEFLCTFCLSDPLNESTSNGKKEDIVKLKVQCDMVNLRLHIHASFSDKNISKTELQKYLFKVVLAAYWNHNHLEYFQKPRRIESTAMKGITFYEDPIWENDQLYNYTNFGFEISVDGELWVDYGRELSEANHPEGFTLNPILNAKKYYLEASCFEDDEDIDYLLKIKRLPFGHKNDNGEFITSGIMYEDYSKEVINASKFNAFIDRQVKSPKKVFVSYSHEDTLHRKTLQQYLINLQRENLIEIWHDGLINPGDDWDLKIIQSMEEADIVIMLISQSYIASSYVYRNEMPKALSKVENKKGVIFPFILENCDWKEWQIGGTEENKSILESGKKVGAYQAMPISGLGRLLPLNKWQSGDDAWMALVNELRNYCKI